MTQNILNAGLFILLSSFQSSIYDIQIQTVQNDTVGMSAFGNKKILITTINSVNPSATQLLFLDSIQNQDTSIKVIAVPALDFGGVENNTALSVLSTSLGLDFTIVKSSFVKKQAGSNQHPLFKWLTYVNENSHFNNDADAIGQFFIVSKNGTLYSVLPPGVPNAILFQSLNQNMEQ